MGKKGKKWGYLMEPVVAVDGVEVDNPRFNADFKRWYDNMARKSVSSADMNARSLFRFTNKIGLTLEEFTSGTKKDLQHGENLIMDFVSEQFDEGKSPWYINNYVKCVKNWLRFNGVLLVRKIYTGNNNLTPTIEDEVIPDKDDLLQIMNYATTRGMCSISFIAFAGLRPMTLGNATGTDGLKVKDIPDLVIGDSTVSFKRIPVRIIVRPELSKTKRQYETFITTEGSKCLKAYLESRMSRGEKLDRQSAIISVKRGFERAKFRKDAIALKGRRGRHISTKTITGEIRNAIRPRFSWRPYVLRSYFATKLLIAESAGKITHAYRQFFQGHSGGMLARYTIDKHLPEEVIEDMRRSFLQSEEYLAMRDIKKESNELTTMKTMVEMGAIDLNNPEIRDYIFEKIGVTDVRERILSLEDYRDLDYEDAEKMLIYDELRVDAGKMQRLQQKENSTRVKNSTKIIEEESVEEFLNKGWDIYKILPSGSIVIKKFTYISKESSKPSSPTR